MKRVVLTNRGSLYGKKMIHDLKVAGIPPDAVVVIHQPFSYLRRQFRSVRRQVGLVDAFLFALRRLKKKSIPLERGGHPFESDYAKMSVPIVETHSTNSEETVKRLNDLAPDLVLLAQCGIVRPPLLRIPRVGTLNAHPGLLPRYRGIDCARWAIAEQDWDGVGSSVHWVDEGVDTGPILAAEPYAPRSGETLDSLDGALADQSLRLLVQTVAGLTDDPIPKGTPQVAETGTLRRKIDRKTEARAARSLSERHPAA